jgi:membrane fusion protein (multidrug efflux system)
VEPVERKNVPVTGDFVGQTEAKETVTIVPRVTGFLEKIYFQEGATVRKGDSLFQIESASYKAALEQAQAKLAQDQAGLIRFQRDMARLEPLVKEQAATQQDFDAAVSGTAQQQAAIQADQAAIDTAQLNLSYTLIRSPIEGIIGRVNITAGNLVIAGQAAPLATISSFNPIYVNFSIPEAIYLAFRRKHSTGDAPPPVQLDLILADAQPFPGRGRLDFADRTVDPQTGTLGLRAVFPNPKALLLPGQFARVRLITGERKNAVLVPKEAVIETLNTKGVLVVDAGDKAILRTITVDGEYQDRAIVASGLNGDERVVVDGTQKVRPGMMVRPENQGEANAR